MIAYIHCLPADPMVGCLHRVKWQAYCNEEDQELIPLYTFSMGNSVTKKHGRKKLPTEDDNEYWASK